MRVTIRGMKTSSITLSAVIAGSCLWSTATVEAGPNIMALGNYRAAPFKRAEGRESYSGKEVVFSFDDPEFDFGRVVVRSTQPASVVRRDFFVGFSGNDLRVSTKAGGPNAPSVSVQEVEIWLKIRGSLRPNTTYEWEIEPVLAKDGPLQAIPAVIPAFWADGQPIGVEVSISEPVQEDTDRIRRMNFPHGAVKTPQFEKQTGAAWVVLRPRSFGDGFGIGRFSFREVDTPASDTQATMPIPVRYVPIRNEVEDQISEVLDRSSDVLRRAQTPEGFWGAGNDVDANVVLTAGVAAALGEINIKDEKLADALKWLSNQKPPERAAFSVDAVAGRLTCLARYGEFKEYSAVILADALFLTEAQLEDGGWGGRSPKAAGAGDAAIVSDHDHSLYAVRALMESRYAGAEVENRVFRNAMKYWSDAQTADGGFTGRLARYGSISQPTVAYTATGTAGLMTTLDMASGFGAKKCTLYLGSREQLKAIDQGLNWLNDSYDAEYASFGSLLSNPDPYIEPERMLMIGQTCGIAHFNKKDHFVESASDLLSNYDAATLMFGVRGQGGLLGSQGKFAEAPSVRRTAWALRILAAGNAPTVLQRIVLGDEANDWAQYRGDAMHLTRFLGRSSGARYNWRRSSIDRDVSELAEVPLMILGVVGPSDWKDAQWAKIREYCLSGGTVVVDIGDEMEAQRAAIVEAIRKTFPEYSLAELPQDAGVFAVSKDHKPIAGIQAMGNGFRHFLFMPPKSWSCAWHTYDMKQSEQSFHFMEDLLKYATDDTPPRSSFARSTYASPAASSRTMKAAMVQVGSDVPAYPNLIETMSRLMQFNYRTRVQEAKPADADLLWVVVAGGAAPSVATKQEIREAMKSNRQMLVDVVSGNPEWDEAFRTVLKGLDSGVSLQKLPRNDPILTGEIPGTQGFDAVNVAFRKALHDRFSKSGRCDLYGIYWNGKRVGVYSAYDISSGVGYHYFPGCRGVMPEDARQLAMNAFLYIYGGKLHPESRVDAK